MVMDYEPPPATHHRLLIDKLDLIARKEILRLMVMQPPGSAKSTYASILFPPYLLARSPKQKVVAGSYNTDLSDYFGKKARAVADSTRFRGIWSESLDPGAGRSKNEWVLTNGSEYYGTGVGAGVTGRRADHIIIDAPIKGRQEADSKHVRDLTWDWYMTDIRSRRKPDGTISIITTRWHEDDLCGRILNFGKDGITGDEKPVYISGSGWFKAYDGEMWYVLSLPAIAELEHNFENVREGSRPEEGDIMGRQQGEVLWPAYYKKEEVYQERESQDERNWSALWQCRPSPEAGDFFKRENIKFYTELPEHLEMYGSGDYAVTAGGGDYTELGIGGIDPEDNLYLVDWWFGQTDSAEWMKQLFRLQGLHKCGNWFEEKGQIEKSLGPFILKMMIDSGMYFNQKKIAMKHDKPTRAQTIRGRLSQGKVYFPAKGSERHGKWVDHLIQQMLVFPSGTHDDAVDVLSLFGLGLMSMRKAGVPHQQPKVPGPYEFDQICTDEKMPVSPYRG